MNRITWKTPDGKWGLKNISWDTLDMEIMRIVCEATALVLSGSLMNWTLAGTARRIDRVSMISEQVKHLLEIADRTQNEAFFCEWYKNYAKDLRQAADTIESLSAKLQAVNMERSAQDCGGWILCSERLPGKTGFYMVTKKIKETGEHFTGKSRFDTEKGWNDPLNFVDIVAWQPLPEPYHEP